MENVDESIKKQKFGGSKSSRFDFPGEVVSNEVWI